MAKLTAEEQQRVSPEIRRRRRNELPVSIAILAAASVLVLLVAAPAFAGATYDYDVVATGYTDWVIKATVRVDGTRQRVDFSHVTAPFREYHDGSFAISTDGGRTATFVYPEQKLLLEKELTRPRQPNMKDNGFQILIEQPEVSVRDAGDGGPIEGVSTHKSELHISFRRTVDVAGNKLSTQLEYTSQVWTTDEIDAGTTTFIMTRHSDDQMPAEINALIAARFGRHDRFVIKRITTLRLSSPGKSATTTTWTATATNYRKLSIPDPEFAIPAGYERVTKPP